ncbi:MAG TPA: transposase [Methylophilaceae bacterium]|nr:transposase [Methylophilaceae bacterium]
MGKEIHPISRTSTHSAGRRRQKFSKEFKLNAVKLLQAGQKPATQLALELGIRRNLLYKWAETLAEHQGNSETAFNGPGRNKLGHRKDTLKAENARLKRELKRMTEERDILKKAAAYFTKAHK